MCGSLRRKGCDRSLQVDRPGGLSYLLERDFGVGGEFAVVAEFQVIAVLGGDSHGLRALTGLAPDAGFVGIDVSARGQLHWIGRQEFGHGNFGAQGNEAVEHR